MTLRNLVKRILLYPFAVFCGDKNHGKIALTFDDGPNPQYTESVSRLLYKADARCTFFLLGSRIREYPNLVQRLIEDGHEVASHSMTHPEIKDLPYRDMSQEIEAAYALTMADGRRTIQNRYLRPPKGAVTFSLLIFCVLNGIRLIFWNRDPEDYKAQSANEILMFFDRDPLQAGDIVLLHDKTAHIVEALPGLLQRIAQQNLKPVIVSELLGHS
jgi:peptidoglycan/xylan/chitin deacetylase (PgdA/CDA1 family)